MLDPDFSFAKIAAPYAQVQYICMNTYIWCWQLLWILLLTKVISGLKWFKHLQELLDVRQQQRNGTQLVQEIRKQADDVQYLTYDLSLLYFLVLICLWTLLFPLQIFTIYVKLSISVSIRIKKAYIIFQARTHTMSMPYRVQRIEEFVKQLDSGDVKLRVRVLEVTLPVISEEEIVYSFCEPPGDCIFLGAVWENREPVLWIVNEPVFYIQVFSEHSFLAQESMPNLNCLWKQVLC